MTFCSMNAIAAIRAFTNPEEYELIIMETCDNGIYIKDFHNNLQLDKAIHIKHSYEEDQGNAADMNEGAKLATGDYLLFMQNDVMVTDKDWLPNLRYYLDNNLAEVITPMQVYESYEKMKEYKVMSLEEGLRNGLQDAGMIMMKREVFDKINGWDERFRKIYMWGSIERRLKKVGIGIKSTVKTFINHIGGTTYWYDVVKGTDVHAEGDAWEKVRSEKD